jgi:hypothetical protein
MTAARPMRRLGPDTAVGHGSPGRSAVRGACGDPSVVAPRTPVDLRDAMSTVSRGSGPLLPASRPQ